MFVEVAPEPPSVGLVNRHQMKVEPLRSFFESVGGGGGMGVGTSASPKEIIPK